MSDLTSLSVVKTLMLPNAPTNVDSLLSLLITDVSSQVENYCSRRFLASDYTEILDGPHWTRILQLKNFPINSVASIMEDIILLTPVLDYSIVDYGAGDPNREDGPGQIYREMQDWSTQSLRNITVVYNAGYHFPSIAAPNFTGSGLNDLSSGGAYVLTPSATYVLKISATGTPDSFQYQKNGGAWSGSILITGTTQTIADGVTATFGATTGHTSADSWSILAQARDFPYDLELAVAKTVFKCYRDISHGTLGVQAHAMKDGSVTMVPADEYLKEVKNVLDRYTRKVLV